MADDPDPRHMIHFCREFLPGVLTEACGATPSDAAAVADDVLSRAEAAADLDQNSREVLSAPFFEESFDHEPDEAPAWMKAVTTLVIRNSRLEDLHASGPVGAGGITGITTYGLGPLAHLIAARRGHPAPAGASGSPFAGLADAYPRAWSCLTALRTALASGGGRVGYRLPEAPSPGLPDETEIIAAQLADHLELPSGDFSAAVFSGVDPRFDQSAIKLLKAADEDELLLGLSSLSRISRSSRKLLRTLEFLLSRKTTILTTNYLLTRKEVHVRRRDLVKPVSERPMDGLRNLDGLSGSHRRTVESYVLQVSQDKD